MSKRVTQNLESDFPGENEAQEVEGPIRPDTAAAPIMVQAETFEQRVEAARAKTHEVGQLRAHSQTEAKVLGDAVMVARAKWDVLFEVLKGLHEQNRNRIGYAGSKLSRLLNHSR